MEYQAKRTVLSSGGDGDGKRMVLLQIAVAVAYAAGTMSLMRLRSWKFRHGVRFRVLNTADMEGIGDIAQGCGEEDRDTAEEESEVDSLLSPFSQDFVFGVEVDGDIVGIDTVRVDGRNGYVEDVKLLNVFTGFGLEEGIRQFCLKNISQMSNGNVVRVRHLAFAWNRLSCTASLNAGMNQVASWGYVVVDDGTEMKQLTCLHPAKSDGAPLIRPAMSLSSMILTLRRCCDYPVLLQYWDVYDATSETVIQLCPNSCKIQKESYRESPFPVPERYDVESLDHMEFSRLPSRNCSMQIGSSTCSLGEFVEREGSIGSLCTFTIYCGSAEFRRSPGKCLAEAREHIQYWARLATENLCDSMVVFASQCLLENPTPLFLWESQCRLILYEKDVN